MNKNDAGNKLHENKASVTGRPPVRHSWIATAPQTFLPLVVFSADTPPRVLPPRQVGRKL